MFLLMVVAVNVQTVHTASAATVQLENRNPQTQDTLHNVDICSALDSSIECRTGEYFKYHRLIHVSEAVVLNTRRPYAQKALKTMLM